MNLQSSSSKNYFGHCLFVFTTALTLYALVEVLRGMQPVLGWFGLVIAAGAPTAYFVLGFIRPAALGRQLPAFIGALCGLGLATTMAVNWRYGEASGIIHIWAGACLIGWFTFLRWSRKLNELN